MSQLKALLFDVDGTLANTERDGHRVAFNMAFADAGINWVWDDKHYGHLLSVTGGKERMRFHATEQDPEFLLDPDVDATIASIHKNKNRYYQQLLKDGAIALRPGVARLIQEAREAGITLGIATTTSIDNVTCLLESQLGSESLGWFSVIAAGDMVAAKKPAPDVFLLAMERLGLEADVCLALEDSWNGLQSAKAAGLKTLVTLNAYTQEDDLSAAELIVDSLGEPDRPVSVLKGNMSGAYVDIATAREVLAS